MNVKDELERTKKELSLIKNKYESEKNRNSELEEKIKLSKSDNLKANSNKNNNEKSEEKIIQEMKITNKLSEKKELVFVKKLEYKTNDLGIGISELTNFEKAKLTNKLKEVYDKREKNQFIVVEGNADSLQYAKDPNNYKNIDLAFKRALKSVFDLDEAKLNNLYFQINTKANDRDIKIFICYYE